jgi:uncharacterized protein YjbJ (UPF0337 family)
VDTCKGKVKQVVGKVLDYQEMEYEGNIQKNVGKAQSGFGDLKENIKKSK